MDNNTYQKVSHGYVVLGPYRSGTSLTSAIMARLGVNFGPTNEMFSGTKFNPYGYFEREDINEKNGLLISSAGQSLADPGTPIEIFNNCDKTLANQLKFDWMYQNTSWGIKDPRMCATLWTWIQLGLINQEKLSIIHVKRSLDSATASGFKDPLIPRYCDNTEPGVKKMLAKYIDLAEWHVENLNVPTFTLQYEELINSPETIITDLANFIGVRSPRKIKAATRLVGKNQAIRYYYLHRLFIRAPAKLWRIVSGKEKLSK